MKKVAIVILNWNGRQMLKEYLPLVLKYSREEATVYVADNASTDDSLTMLKQEFPEVELIVLERNWGFADGYNKALAKIEAEYFVLLNSDIEVTPDWLKPMVAYMDGHQDVAACQPKQPVSPSSVRFSTSTVSNMQGPAGDISTVSAIPSAEGVSSRRWKRIADSMTKLQMCSGLQAQR